MSLGSIHVGKQDVVVVCPVYPLVGIINSESGWTVNLRVDYDPLTSAVHAYAPDVRGFTAVYPEHIPRKKYDITQRLADNSRLPKKIILIAVRAGSECLPCLWVQSQVRGVLETGADQDGRVEPVGFGHFQCIPFSITPIQILSYPVHC